MTDILVQKKTMSAQVADALRKRILSGEYRAGERLRQEHIAAEIGISRIPVREALHQLHSEGFVTLVSQKGAVVSEISLDEIREMLELRARIETWLLSLAIPLMSEADFAAARAASADFDAEGERTEFSHELNWRFHKTLYAPSKRHLTIDMVAKIHQQLERYTRLMVSLAESQEKASREHAMLLDLCRERDTLRAVNLLDQHIMDAGKHLMQRITELREADKAADALPRNRRASVTR